MGIEHFWKDLQEITVVTSGGLDQGGPLTFYLLCYVVFPPVSTCHNEKLTNLREHSLQ